MEPDGTAAGGGAGCAAGPKALVAVGGGGAIVDAGGAGVHCCDGVGVHATCWMLVYVVPNAVVGVDACGTVVAPNSLQDSDG